MPVKRKLNKKRTKVPRNVKINQKGSKRASQKKRGRSGRGRGRKSQRGGTVNEYCSTYTTNWEQDTITTILSNKKKIEEVNELALTHKPDLTYGQKLEIQTNIETKLEEIYEVVGLEPNNHRLDLGKSANAFYQSSGVHVPPPDEGHSLYIKRKLWTYDSNTGDFHTFLFGTKESPNQKLRCFLQEKQKWTPK